MSHLIAISMGPVQDFIAAARRTNDLYAGSNLLNEMVKAAAGVVASAGGKLIFPSAIEAAGANKILAALPSEPRKVCDAAREAAKGVLVKRWDSLLESYTGLLHEDRGRKQVAHFLEFYAAWWPWDGRDETYREARQEVERLLAGRKALRDFSQPEKNNVPKSPLDPAQDTVLRDGPTGDLTTSPLWLKPNEHLDAISLVKRAMSADLASVPSTVDIAARSYLSSNPELREWLDAEKVPHGVVHRSRRDELLEEGRIEDGKHGEIVARLGKAEPTPYFAILVADGDEMGARISALESRSSHQQFSGKLSGFAAQAKEIIERCDGHLVYAGGDDVLAFLPLHTCLNAAAALAEGFHEHTEMNLTVGLAIVHYMAPLYLSLGIARGVERTAKQNGRNRLRVEWQTRGGQSRAAEHPWEDGFSLDAWKEWQDLFAQGLTRGFAYELATLGREAQRAELDPDVLRAEADRLFARKEWEGKPEDPRQLSNWRTACDDLQNGSDAVRLSDLLILMQGLASRTREAEVMA